MEAHIDIGHGNANATYKFIKNSYFWPNMREEIYETIKSCTKCLAYNENNVKTGYYPLLTGESMERIGIDLIGPLPETKLGNKYIIVAIDYKKKYVFMKAIPKKTANQIAKFIFNDIILIHGCPSVILSDNGKEFNNELLKYLCQLLSINKKFSSPYRPQTNGLVERTNRTLIRYSRKMHTVTKRIRTNTST